MLETSTKLPPMWTEAQALHLHQGSWSSKFAFHCGAFEFWNEKAKAAPDSRRVCSLGMTWEVLESMDVAGWGMGMFLNTSAKISAAGAQSFVVIYISNRSITTTLDSCTEELSCLAYFCSRQRYFFPQNIRFFQRDGQIIRGGRGCLQIHDSINTCFCLKSTDVSLFPNTRCFCECLTEVREGWIQLGLQVAHVHNTWTCQLMHRALKANNIWQKRCQKAEEELVQNWAETLVLQVIPAVMWPW